MRSRLPAGIVACLLALVPLAAADVSVAVAHPSGAGTAKPASATSKSRSCTVPMARRVLVVGDSLTVGADRTGKLSEKLRAQGFEVVGVDAEVGRMTAAGLDSLLARNAIPLNVVVALGTNDVSARRSVTTWSKTVQRVLNLLGPDRRVVFVNAALARSKTEAERTTAYNRVLSRLAQTQVNVSLVDWARGAGADAELLRPDGVHLTGTGYAKRADAITAALVGLRGAGTACR
jgi:lysophospholipase L1-like esterase